MLSGLGEREYRIISYHIGLCFCFALSSLTSIQIEEGLSTDTDTGMGTYLTESRIHDPRLALHSGVSSAR
jgi:hypothetical protein